VPGVPLRETPADRLGSVPPGFGLAVGSKAPDDQDYKTRPTPAQMLDIAARALAK
jgi:hypothetical protein